SQRCCVTSRGRGTGSTSHGDSPCRAGLGGPCGMPARGRMSGVRPTGPLDRVAGAHDAAVLAVARRGEPVSRAGLADALQVTPQAISKILTRLMERGLMAESGTFSSGPGKPTTLYRIVPERSEEHTSELQSRFDLVCRLLLE